MAREWFYEHEGEEHGPVDMSALKDMAADGSLAQTDLVWTEGMDDWVEARRVKGIFAAGAGKPKKQARAGAPARRGAGAGRAKSKGQAGDVAKDLRADDVVDDGDEGRGARRKGAGGRRRPSGERDGRGPTRGAKRGGRGRSRGGRGGASRGGGRGRRGRSRDRDRDRDYDDRPAVPQGAPGLVIAGFICAFLAPLLGLILCLVGRGEAKRRRAGVGLSTAGIIISLGWMLLLLIYVLAVVVFLASVERPTPQRLEVPAFETPYQDDLRAPRPGDDPFVEDELRAPEEEPVPDEQDDAMRARDFDHPDFHKD